VEGHKNEVHRPDPIPVSMLEWFERVVLGDFNDAFTHVDRLLVGRFRMLVQASLRHDDLRNTPLASLKWISSDPGTLDEALRAPPALSGPKRALVGKAKVTKTGYPRPWVVSNLGVTSDTNGWMEKVIELLREAHSLTGSSADDHVGKRASPKLDEWEAGPPESQADTMHLRYLLILSRRYEDQSRFHFTDNEIEAIRTHCCKCTLTSAAQHFGISRKQVRKQGGWTGKTEDLMPDHYLRHAELMALKLQEEVLSKLQQGHEMPHVEAESVFPLKELERVAAQKAKAAAG